MKKLSIKSLKLSFIPVKTVFLIALRKFRSYDWLVHPHGELALVGYYYKGAYSPLRAFFMRSNSMRSHFMVKLEGDIFGCAGFLCSQSTNPFQLCHLNYLVVIGKAPIYKGAHSHA